LLTSSLHIFFQHFKTIISYINVLFVISFSHFGAFAQRQMRKDAEFKKNYCYCVTVLSFKEFRVFVSCDDVISN